LDIYQLEELIGEGGMAEVYRAYDRMLQREVAVKVLAASLSDDAEYTRRFQAEAHRVGSLCHPHLVPIYHAGEAEVDGKRLLYLVMPLLQGSLRDLRQREGRLPPSEAARLILQVADGLEAAHRSGFVHRDIKPGNVLLDVGGHPLLADFGIALELCSANGSRTATQTGKVMGTPGYMAPEQLSGGAIDQRADVYALGAVLYELLTGQPPFNGATAYDVAAHTLYAPLMAPSALVPAISPALDRAVLTALARDPDARYASANAFAKAVQGAMADRRPDPVRWEAWAPPVRNGGAPTVPVRPELRRGLRYQPLKLALVVACALLLAAFTRLLLPLPPGNISAARQQAVPAVAKATATSGSFSKNFTSPSATATALPSEKIHHGGAHDQGGGRGTGRHGDHSRD
jgi:serine/threonine protein kinase